MFLQLPVLVSSSFEGLYSAQLLDDDESRTIGESASKAIDRLKKKLHKQAKQGLLYRFWNWTDAEYSVKTFPIQPMYYFEKRRYPAGPTIQLPIRYVRLTDENESVFCFLPDIEERFYCPDPKQLTSMLGDTVRSITATLSPEQIRDIWPPAKTELAWIRIRTQPESTVTLRVSTPYLKQVAEPLVSGNRPLLPTDLRQKDIANITRQMKEGSFLLVGESGVGKSTLLAIAAREAEKFWKKQNRKEKKEHTGPLFWSTSAGRLISGMRYLGQWQERLEAIIAELNNLRGTLVLENLRELITTGGSDPRESLGGFLVPYLRNGQIRLIAETTPSEWEACSRMLPSLVEQMATLRLEPLSMQDEIQLVNHVITHRLSKTAVNLSEQVPSLVQKFCHQFQNGSSPPSASIPFVEHLTSQIKQAPPLDGQLDTKYVVEHFSRHTGLPEVLLQDELLLQRDEVASSLAKEVIGQDEACELVAGIVTRIKAALNDPIRPFGCLLFCGPTGVGKTQLALSLAKYLFGTHQERTPLVRLDMSEYSTFAAGYRFLHDSNGESASWLQKIRTRPLNVLLLDEIEKASPEVFDILLSLLDEGRLTDRMGRVTSFRSTVVIMTSNLGGKRSTAMGFGDLANHDYSAEVRKAFRPEFFNRLDSIVPFLPLTKTSRRKIVLKELEQIARRDGLSRMGIELTYSESLIDYLSTAGINESLGARPLQRLIETELVAPLARWLVANRPARGSRWHADWQEAIDFRQVPSGSSS